MNSPNRDGYNTSYLSARLRLSEPGRPCLSDLIWPTDCHVEPIVEPIGAVVWSCHSESTRDRKVRAAAVHHAILWLRIVACVSHLSVWFIRVIYSCP